MRLWIFIIVTLFIQERVSTDAALFQARVHNYNIWIIHFIWLVATSSTIIAGYIVGKLIQKRLKGSHLSNNIYGFSKKIEHAIGKQGEKYAFILLGLVNFPYLNGLLASVVNVPFRILFPLMFLGDGVWYVTTWIINIYIRNHVENTNIALYIVIGTGVVFGIIYKMLFNLLTKKS